MERRDFFKTGLITATAPAFILAEIEKVKRSREPMVISTWSHGINANEEAMKVLNSNGSALNAVEVGAKISESDPSIQSVGLGGRPDRDGHVTLVPVLWIQREMLDLLHIFKILNIRFQ